TNELMNVNGSGALMPSCYDQSISADGRWVVLACTANNLFPSVPMCSNSLYGMTPCTQIAVRDRCVSNGTAVPGCTPGIELVSADTLGNQGTDHSEAP